MKPIIPEKGTPVLGAALISSFGIYCPIPIVRGAIFGLFPGIANRSWRMSVEGPFIGACFEVIWFVLCACLRMGAWDPRLGYNVFLAHWLPSSAVVITHCAGPWPIGFQFHINIMLWLSIMVFGWWGVWRPRLPASRLLFILITTNVLAIPACALLWIVSPMDHWWTRGAAPFGDLDGIPWLVVFLSTFPICGVLIAQWFKQQHPESLTGLRTEKR